ncbi:hypothetical protein [Rhodococcus sp. C3V]|uniref:hypothetical protein n=1 Tax=Rhodococcus sp. C3V TaxID=3034165 RepID=UPI0006425837|nr:hypothetical protein [Rhodococcus sp. C3V]KLN67946.1 hypothetical protein ABM90_30420 [Rhodococcus erythropolis]MDF3317298.1 hypothetical protein [Rhodococcus sp. C3V]
MPLTKKFSEMYDDALVALAAASQRPATVVNVDGHYAIRVDLEYSRYVVATNSPRGLWDEPDASGSWLVCIVHTDDAGIDVLLSEAQKPWLIDAFDAAVDRLEADGNAIVADADFGAIHHTGERLPDSDAFSEGDPSSGVSLN